jgi:hypothetical protein
MATIILQLEDAKEFFGKKLTKKMEKAALRGLLSTAMRLHQTIITQIIPARSPQPVDRGVFRAGWRAYLTTEMGKECAVIENRELHAAFIEHGVRASNVKGGRRVREILAEWALRKHYVSNEIEAHSFAFNLLRKMKQRGVFNGGQGFGILKEATEYYAPQFLPEEVAREMASM